MTLGPACLGENPSCCPKQVTFWFRASVSSSVMRLCVPVRTQTHTHTEARRGGREGDARYLAVGWENGNPWNSGSSWKFRFLLLDAAGRAQVPFFAQVLRSLRAALSQGWVPLWPTQKLLENPAEEGSNVIWGRGGGALGASRGG